VQEKIETTAQLRRFLADLLQKVSNGNIEPETARDCVKIAHALNESFNVELKMRLVAQKVGDIVPRLGMVQLGEPGPEGPILIEGQKADAA